MENIRKLGINDYENFRKVFMVFESEPFYEAWTEDDYKQEFLDLYENGKLFGIFIDGEMLGLITIKERFKKWDELDIDVEKSIYLSDVAVKREARKNGYATKLLDFIISEYGDDFDLYFRTNLEGSMSEGIARKKGFEVIKDKVQTVYFKRTRPDIPEVDQRKYLIRRRGKNEDTKC